MKLDCGLHRAWSLSNYHEIIVGDPRATSGRFFFTQVCLAMLATEKNCKDSMSYFLEFPVEKAVRSTLARASREHSLRVTSRLLLVQRA